VPFSVRNSAGSLRYVSLIVVYVEFGSERVTDDHWFYLLDRKFKFNRVTEQKNLSPFTLEAGKTVLSLEFTCHMKDEVWTLSDEQLFQLAKDDLEKIHFLKDKIPSISDYTIKRVPNVYEIYYKDFDRHAALVLSYLREFENVVTIGRRGLFLQGDQHQAVEMGLRMGENLAIDQVDRTTIESYYRTYARYLDES
jgi:protoporphyrinogen oxidase